MTLKRGAIYAFATVLAICALWFVRHRRDHKIDQEIKSPTLSQNDAAKLIVDPRRHTIVTVTRAGTKATFLPSNGASVDIGRNGSVKVTTRAWGTEVRPFVGCALGTDIVGRAAVGLNLFYWTRWELGGGLLAGSNIKDARLFMHVSYNLYDSWYLSIGADNRGTAHLMAGLKF